MGKDSMQRVTYTLPPEIVAGVKYLSGRLGISRSALVAQLMAESVPELVRLLEEIPENPTPGDVLRFRGRSQQVIDERFEHARRLKDDLFSQ